MGQDCAQCKLADLEPVLPEKKDASKSPQKRGTKHAESLAKTHDGRFGLLFDKEINAAIECSVPALRQRAFDDKETEAERLAKDAVARQMGLMDCSAKLPATVMEVTATLEIFADKWTAPCIPFTFEVDAEKVICADLKKTIYEHFSSFQSLPDIDSPSLSLGTRNKGTLTEAGSSTLLSLLIRSRGNLIGIE
jgi:hypothetical protein